MAEGGVPQKDLFSRASADYEETFCAPCINKGKWVAVEGYCQICQEYLCSNCLGVHKNLRMTKGHTILHKNQMPGGQGQNTCIEVCKTHHPEIVRFYCKAHDEPGCVDCMTLNHTFCHIDRVQDISDGFQATHEFKFIQQKLRDFHKELEVIKDALDDNLKNLDVTFDNIQHQITSFRKHINVYLDQIKITDEVAEMKKRYEAETNKLIAKNESMKSELKDIIQKIQNDSDVNVNSIFVITKQAQQKLMKMENEITEIKQSQQQLQPNNRFLPTFEIEKLVSASSPTGKLVNTTASYWGTINVKMSDKEDCWIKDCTLLGPDKMVVTDNHNKNIKLIDISNKTVKSSYDTSVPPYGVTAVSTDLVAVTLPEEGTIQLLNVTSTFTKQREIQVNKDCLGIAYKDGKFAVTYNNPERVNILDIQGQILHLINSKDNIHQDPAFITFGQDKETVIKSTTNKVSVVKFEGQGQILPTYTHKAVISGFVITPGGVLFVCSQGEECVHAVSPDFKTSRTIIDTELYPKSISYCDINQRLYIINRDLNSGENTIKVYELNE